MDWFLYDNGLRHERVKDTMKAYFCYCHTLLQTTLWLGNFTFLKLNYQVRKEINQLLSNGMSNIYLKVTIETFSKLRFSRFKIFVTMPLFGKLQLTQISMILKPSCWNLKINCLGATLCVVFSIILILKGIMTF